MPVNDLRGQRFGRLIVLNRSENQGKDTRWLCKCICGAEKTILGRSLVKGATNSCGCLRKENARERFTTHGGRYDKLVKVRASMISRCYNPNDNAYRNYGERGIKVCDRWMKSFEAFLEDMGENPDGTSLDRIDNNGDYTPQNCRWATRLEQNNNTRATTVIEYQGVRKPLSYWAKDLQIHVETLRSRLVFWGGNVELAFERPVRRKT